MPFSDSMFLFEIVVEELTSFTDCKEFFIRSKFADVFKLTLKDPNDSDPLIPSTRRAKKKIKVRDENASDQKPPVEGKVQSGQSILFTSSITTLITTMKNYPIEITLCNKEDHKKKIGSIHVPWSPLYIDYLYMLATKADPAPIVVSGGHNVYDDTTSKRVAAILLNIKLTHLRDKITPYGRSLAVSNQNTRIHRHAMFKSNPAQSAARTNFDDTGTIKTVYSSGKRKKNFNNKSKAQKSKKLLIINQDEKIEDATKIDSISEEKNQSVLAIETQKENINQKINLNPNTLYLVKSDNDLKKKMQDHVVRTKSCSFINRKHFNFLNYVFGCTDKALDNRVFCVGYFTVENEFKEGSSKSSSAESPSKNTSPKGTASKDTSIKKDSTDCECKGGTRALRICDKDCTMLRTDYTCASKSCAENASKLNITQCDKVRCNILERRKLPLPANDTIHLDLTSLKKGRMEELGEAVEKVVGGINAKMKYDDKTCYCECECTFGFVKRTTYCTVCGGYEKPGEDLSKKILTGPFPCPVFHKLIDKNKKSTSGSEKSKMCDTNSIKKSKPASPPPAPAKLESDREYCRKKKKEKRDERFKFNYGYTAPQIGHSRCAMPCTGTLNAVPRNMGWLWTADDVPGMKEIARGWKPGAISKRLLSMLNKAKSNDNNVLMSKPVKRPKKRVEDKPTLIVCKRNGEYIIEMQVEPGKDECNVDNCSPLVYKIAPDNNEERIKAKERKQRRLIRKAVKEVWSDHYDPDACQKNACFKTYQQAIGLLPYDPNNPDCNCPEENKVDDDLNSCSCDDNDISSECSSLDVDWEIHFSPPIACYNNEE